MGLYNKENGGGIPFTPDAAATAHFKLGPSTNVAEAAAAWAATEMAPGFASDTEDETSDLGEWFEVRRDAANNDAYDDSDLPTDIGHFRRSDAEKSMGDDGSVSIPPPAEWLNKYNKMLDRCPLRTKMCTAFVVSAFGSALGSYLSARAKEERTRSQNKPALLKINWVDVLSYAIYGGLINAPISHYWFEWLALHGPSSNTASVLVDQLAVQPPLLACK